MEKVLSFIITFVLIVYVLKFVMKLAAPFLMRYVAKRMFGDIGKQFYEHADNHAQKQESEEKASRTENRTTKSDDGIYLKPKIHKGESVSDSLGGDYVDYEDV